MDAATIPTHRRSTLVTLALLLSVLLTVLVPATARADAGAEGAFVAAVNAERAAAGLPALSVAGDLVAVARAHSARMADSGNLHHNPNLGSDVSGWQRVGENVGKGPDVGAIHEAFMASPGHRTNILDGTWTEVGIGVVVRDGRVWVTQVFRQPMAAAAPAAAPAPAPEPEPEPAPEPAPAAPAPAAEQAPAPADDAPAEKPAPEPDPEPVATDGRILQMLTRVAPEDEAIDAAAA